MAFKAQETRRRFIMSASKPISIGAGNKVETRFEKRQEMANSFPRQKKNVSRVSSSPVCAAGDAASYGAELRRRSDNFFNSFDTFCEELTKPRASTSPSDGGGKSSESSPDSEKLRIDAWLQSRKNRRHSSPTLALHGDKVGSAV